MAVTLNFQNRHSGVTVRRVGSALRVVAVSSLEGGGPSAGRRLNPAAGRGRTGLGCVPGIETGAP